MALLRGQTITLHNLTQTGVDALNAPVCTETLEYVEDILVCPASTEAVSEGLELYGKHAVYELMIPKGDTHKWEDREVSFFGQRWRTFGFALQYPEYLTPGPWDRKIRVERYG